MLRFKNTRLASTVLSSAIGVLIGVGSAFGNPLDPTVVAGAASFDTVGSELNVTNSSGAIIDWNSFSIGQDELTRFIQESSSSSVLNRVIGGNLSQILGDLQSNGRVFLINSNGIVMGEGAVIDTAGFIGSTLDITNQAFSSANYTFTGDGGAIDNRGLIHVTANGDIALIASSIENSGVLRSDNGDILLAAGKSVSVSFDDFQNLSFEVHAPQGEAVNLGDIIAGGGNVSILGGQVTNSGSVEPVESPDGRIFLQAIDMAIVSGSLKSNGGDIHVEGRQVELRDASVDSGADHGSGDISLLGDKVGLFSGTKVSASGNHGGGNILIGGEQQGRGDTRTSEFVYLDENASVESNGGNTGDGGRVILFAENSARINGSITARGGELSGDGGFIETSGLIGLRVNATPDAGANNGAAGEWLIDPNDIIIQGLIVKTLTVNAADAFIVISDAIIDPELIATALETSDVTIDTGTTGSEAGDITINSVIRSIGGAEVDLTTSLTFNAANNININASVELAGTGRTLQFNSAQDGGIGSSIFSTGDVAAGRREGGPFLLATTVEFLGGGLTLPEFSVPFGIIADSLRVVGGVDQTGSFLDLAADSVFIDELTITAGTEDDAIVFGGGNNDIEIGFLRVNNLMPSGPPIAFLEGGNYTLTNGGSISLPAPTEPFARITFSGNLVNQGNLDISGGGLFDFAFDSFDDPIKGSLTNQSGATITLSGGSSIASNETIINHGRLNVIQALEEPDVIAILADLQNSGVVNVGPGASLYVDSVENSGLVDIDAGALLETKSFTLNQGEIHLQSGGILDLFDNGGGSIGIPVDLTVGDGSSITGNGIIATDGTVFVEAGGIIAPGDSPGALFIESDLTLFDGAILDIELAGASPDDFDFISVTGDLTVGGPGSTTAPAPGVVLKVSNLGGYDPDPNFSHNVIEVGGSVFQSATPFNQSANGFDTLNLGFTGNTLGLEGVAKARA